MDGDGQTGFGNHFASEAQPGALPKGQNSPQKLPFGLYAEQLSGSAFTAPRSHNRRSWLYRLRPSASHQPFIPYARSPSVDQQPQDNSPVSPNRLRWSPLDYPREPTDFIDGWFPIGSNGDVSTNAGVAIHLYAVTADMQDRAFFNADGELLIVPQEGRIAIKTEFGALEIEPQEIAIIPRGVRMSVSLPDGRARGYLCENFGSMFQLPELGPIGSNGLANARDFIAPAASFEQSSGPYELVQKFQGRYWTCALDNSPFDVVAWHGNLTPYRYDLRRFNTINTVSFDHPDPSIFTVLTSPSELAGVANCDFVVFPPRWMVAEHTFRPPWFHRNIMSEYMGLIYGEYDAKEGGGFVPGGGSLHNQMSGHGPDRATYEKAIAAELAPYRIENALAFMFESRWVIRPSALALEAAQLDYDEAWAGFEAARPS